MQKRKFIVNIQEVKKFVQTFLHIDPEELKTELHQLLKNGAIGINIEKKDGKVMLAGTNFVYNYRCY